MRYKNAYMVQMRFQISDEDKKSAEKAVVLFEKLQNKITNTLNYLDIIYESFKDYPVKTENVIDKRYLLRKYRDQVLDRFNSIKKLALKCVILMHKFKTDANTSEIMRAFVTTMEDLEKSVNIFADLFSKLSAKDFSKLIVQSVESIKKKSTQLDQLIYDRILDHIDRNILARNWVTEVADELGIEIEEENEPTVVQLWKERQKALES